MKRLWPNIVLLSLSMLVAYSGFEIAYRLYKRYHHSRQAYYFQAIEAPLYMFDREIGYRYIPNTDLHFLQFDPDNHLLRSNTVHVNNMGHISGRDERIPKPTSEFRIAVLGDSFTACVTNDIPWTDILEDRLNADDSLKTILGASAFHVINLGMDGTGIVQWNSVDSHEVQKFAPDMVIVNFITDDIRRKFIYRTTRAIESGQAAYRLTLTCTSLPLTLDNRDCLLVRTIVMDPLILGHAREMERIKQEIYRERMKRLPLLTPYPELFARAVGYRWGLRGRLRPGNDFNLYYDTREKGRKASMEALRRISERHPRVLILHNPVYDEILSHRMPSDLLAFMRMGDKITIHPMRRYLPVPADTSSLRRWFNMPSDRHFSNEGARIYAQAVYRKLKEERGDLK